MRAAFAHIANARSPLPKQAHANEDPFAPSPPVRLFLFPWHFPYRQLH